AVDARDAPPLALAGHGLSRPAAPGCRRQPTLLTVALAERRAGWPHRRDGVPADLPPDGRPAASSRGDGASRGLESPRLGPARLTPRGDLRRGRGPRPWELVGGGG